MRGLAGLDEDHRLATDCAAVRAQGSQESRAFVPRPIGSLLAPLGITQNQGPLMSGWAARMPSFFFARFAWSFE